MDIHGPFLNRLEMTTYEKILGYIGMTTLLGFSVLAVDNSPIKTELFQKPIRLACVGDSITEGVGADKGKDYPSQLATMLGAKWEVRNFGVSGSTLLKKGNHPYAGFLPQVLEYAPDVVVIMLGTNDTKPENWVHKAEFASDYRWLIEQLQKLPAPPRIFICYPGLVAGDRPDGINEAGVQELIPIIDKLAEEMRVGVIDMHSALMADPTQYLPDTVHPSTAGARRLAETVHQALTGKTGTIPDVLSPAPSADIRSGDSSSL